MKLTLIIFVILMASFALSACQPALAVDKDAAMERGKEIYIHNCVRCHHEDGSGFRDIFPPLAGNHIVTLHDPVPVIQVTKFGRGSMPQFQGVLEAEEIADVITYIRNAWENEASAVSPRQVR